MLAPSSEAPPWFDVLHRRGPAALLPTARSATLTPSFPPRNGSVGAYQSKNAEGLIEVPTGRQMLVHIFTSSRTIALNFTNRHPVRGARAHFVQDFTNS